MGTGTEAGFTGNSDQVSAIRYPTVNESRKVLFKQNITKDLVTELKLG